MANRMMELLISLKGQIDKTLPESVRKANADVGELQKKLSKLNDIKLKAEKYKELEKAAQNLGNNFNEATQKAARLADEFRRNQAAAAQYKNQIIQARMALAGMSKSANPEAYKVARANLAQLTAAYKSAQSAVKASEKAFKQAETSVKNARNAVTANQNAMQSLSNTLRQAGFHTEHFATSQTLLQSQLQRTNARLEEARRIQQRHNDEMSRRRNNHENYTNAQQNLYNATGNLQAGMEVSKSIMQPFADAVSVAMDFEAEMSKVKAMTQMDNIKLGNWKKVNSEMKMLTDQAKELGMTTQFTSVQAAQAQFFMAKAGWDANKVFAGMPHILNMAAVENMELGRASEIVTNIMSGFGLEANEVQRAVDVLAYTSTHANTDLNSLGETMKYAAPVAKSFGASLEETATMAKFMADAGIAGSQAGTSLRQGLLRLVAPPKKASKAMQELGVSLSDAQAEWANANATAKAYGITLDASKGPGEQLISVIKQIENGMAGASDQEKIAALNAITGINAVSGWASVMANSSGKISEFNDKLKTCKGAAAQTAKVMQDNTKGAFTRFGSAVEAVAQNIGDVFLPIVRQAVETAAVYATAMAKWISMHQNIVMAAGIAAASIAALIMTALTINVVVSAWKLLSATITMVAGETTMLYAQTRLSALATLFHAKANLIYGASLNALRNPLTTTKNLVSSTGNLMTTLPGKLSGVGKGIISVFAGIPKAILVAFKGIGSGILSAFTFIPKIIMGAFAGLATLSAPVIAAILAIVAVVAVVVGVIIAYWDEFKNVAMVVWNNIKTSAMAAFNHIAGTVMAWVAIVKSKFAEAKERIMNAFNGITGGSEQTAAVVSAVFNTVGWVIGGVFNNAAFIVAAAFDIIVGIVGTAINVVINLVTSIGEIIAGVIELVVKLLNGDWAGAWNAAGKVVDGFSNGTLGTLKTIGEGAMNIFDSLFGKSSEMEKNAQEAQKAAEGTKAAADATANASASAADLAANMEATGEHTEAAAESVLNFSDAMANILASSNITALDTESATAAQNITANLGQIPAGAQENFAKLPPIAAEQTNAVVNEFAQLVTKCQPGADAFIQAANNWGQQAYQNIANWADQMAQVVVDRLTNAWTQISSQFSAGLNVHVTTSGGNVAHNAMGGIYNKGAFLTTFAEKSPEAAIPLDGSSRAVSLWQRAGEMLGMMPKGASGKKSFDVPKTSFVSYPPIESGLAMPPIMNMVDALPPEISTIAEIASPPTEAEMAAAPIAYEPPSAGGDTHIEINMPSITIQGNADSGTVSSIEDALAKAIRDLERRIPDIISSHQHNQRRRSFAT